MKSDIEKIKSRIKKLFALSKSPNANEAATALEMAQKIMSEHGVRHNEIWDFQIIEKEIKANGGKRPSRHENHLVSSIAVAFGCRSAYGLALSKETGRLFWGYTFVGLEHRTVVASFIAEVLLRKLKKARKDYLGTLARVRTKINKTKRADIFCLGWVCTVVDKLIQFTNTQDEKSAIDSFVESLKWGNNLKTIARSLLKDSAHDDFANGRRAAGDVHIQHGVEGGQSEALLLKAQ
jgi:hypothetical protein